MSQVESRLASSLTGPSSSGVPCPTAIRTLDEIVAVLFRAAARVIPAIVITAFAVTSLAGIVAWELVVVILRRFTHRSPALSADCRVEAFKRRQIVRACLRPYAVAIRMAGASWPPSSTMEYRIMTPLTA